jgi:hypothetical protein
MIQHYGVLTGLLNQFVKQVEILCGKSLYVKKLKGQRWGVYKHPGRRGNICNMIERHKRDKYFPDCPLPHFKIATYYVLAQKAGTVPQLKLPRAFHNRDGAYWCVSTPNDAQFMIAAKAISDIYPYV